MARLTDDDVDDAYSRLLRLAKELNLDTSAWQIVYGELAHGGAKRSTYRITRNGERLFSLGYTRRNAVDALTAAATALEVVLREG